MDGFQIVSFIGKGSYGAVYKVKRRSDPSKTYAIKELDLRSMSPREKQEALNEIRLMASVSHQNICKYRDSFFEKDKLHIVMEFATKGDLAQAIYERKKRRRLFDEAQVWSMFLQIALALRHLHSRKILHRDLKSANVFLMEDGIIKLGDMGVSKLLKADDKLAKTVIGTPYYLAPELWNRDPYDEKSDVWSLGCVLYEMLTFRHPYEAHDLKGLANKVLYGRRQPIASHYSTDINNVLNVCLTHDPKRRLSVEELFSMQEIRSRLHMVPTARIRPGSDGQPPQLQASPQQARMISTIRFKRQGRDLVVNLPSPKYGSPKRAQAPLLACSPNADSTSRLPKIGGPIRSIAEHLNQSSPSLDKAALQENSRRVGALMPFKPDMPKPPRPNVCPNAFRRPVMLSVAEARRRLPRPGYPKVAMARDRDIGALWIH
ncbi:Protein kinase domain [Carpediemonas membranifera]|uniref:non-specific serine/threonine protein kinase n=1 Tax=Carpediemonas membranifera TaxID=201153 RepID=A0A8J6B689_9EUKA|nr:Protein kinase domain [Carpediemonas membranifera]|eukprot:KAG9390867.1 Protein kinase domain [Carpediemonas membranifera]